MQFFLREGLKPENPVTCLVCLYPGKEGGCHILHKTTFTSPLSIFINMVYQFNVLEDMVI